MTSRALAIAVTLPLFVSLVSGCQSQLDKCKATTDETAKREIDACKDAACKEKAEANRKAFIEACEAAAKK